MGSKKLRIEYHDDVAVIRVEGDAKKRPEHAEIRLAFPGGEVSLTRASDADPARGYWVHVHVTRPQDGMIIPGETLLGRISDARLDQHGKSASDVNLGDFESPDLYHLAVRVAAAGVAKARPSWRTGEELTHERWEELCRWLEEEVRPELWFWDEGGCGEIVRTDEPDTGERLEGDDAAALLVADLLRRRLGFDAPLERVLFVNREAYRDRNDIPDDDAQELANIAQLASAAQLEAAVSAARGDES